jgi:hypothetical protein
MIKLIAAVFGDEVRRAMVGRITVRSNCSAKIKFRSRLRQGKNAVSPDLYVSSSAVDETLPGS